MLLRLVEKITSFITVFSHLRLAREKYLVLNLLYSSVFFIEKMHADFRFLRKIRADFQNDPKF